MSEITATLDRVAAIAAEQQAKARAQGQGMREKHPEFAAFVDDYRKTFGADLAYFRDKETGYEYRRKHG